MISKQSSFIIIKSILSQYDAINKIRNLKQNKESIRKYYERINNFFIVELDYRDKTKDITLFEEKLIWLTFVIEKWIKEVKSTKFFDYLANKFVKNLFDAYIITKRKMLKKKRELRQKKERKFQKKYQVTFQQLQNFVDRDVFYESSFILKQQRFTQTKINIAVNITNIEFAKLTISEFVKKIIVSSNLQKTSLEINIVVTCLLFCLINHLTELIWTDRFNRFWHRLYLNNKSLIETMQTFYT